MRLSLDKSRKRPENPDRLIDYKSQRETMKTALGFGKSLYDLQLIRWCLVIKTFILKILSIDIKVRFTTHTLIYPYMNQSRITKIYFISLGFPSLVVVMMIVS